MHTQGWIHEENAGGLDTSRADPGSSIMAAGGLDGVGRSPFVQLLDLEFYI